MYKMGPKNFLLPTLLLSLALLSGAVHGETLDLAVTPETAPSRLLAEAIPGNSTDRTWRLTGPPGRRLHLICTDLTLLKSADCSDGFLSISENGAEEQKICERDSVYSRESVGNQLTVRIRTVPSSSGGRVSCAVLLVNGTVSGGSAQSAVTDTGEYLDGVGQQDTNTPDGGTNKKRIVGGKTTNPHAYPPMAVIQTLDPIEVQCGGTILTKRHILTATSCVAGKRKEELRVVAGAHRITDLSGTQILSIGEGYKVGYQGREEILVLLLNEEIQFGLIQAQQVFLPAHRYQLPYNNVTALGWGSSSLALSSATTAFLKSAYLTVVPLGECRSQYGPWELFLQNPSQICTFSSERDTCKKDTGGPLLLWDGAAGQYVQVGLITDSKPCQRSQKPHLNTELFPYVEGIDGVVSQTVPGLTCRKYHHFIPPV